jgi:hypothetical protein
VVLVEGQSSSGTKNTVERSQTAQLVRNLTEDRHEKDDIELGFPERKLAGVALGVADVSETRGLDLLASLFEHFGL